MEVPSPRCLREELLWLQQSLSVLGSPVVLCHNDLLCKNIIYNQVEGEYKPLKYNSRHFCMTALCCSVICIGPYAQVGRYYLHFLTTLVTCFTHCQCLHWAAELERSDETIQLFSCSATGLGGFLFKIGHKMWFTYILFFQSLLFSKANMCFNTSIRHLSYCTSNSGHCVIY